MLCGVLDLKPISVAAIYAFLAPLFLQYCLEILGRQFLEDSFMPGIGPRLKRERLRLKLSQSALGAIGGVETNAQGNYENGIRSPRADYLSRIADAGIDVSYVVTGFSLERSTPQIEGHANSDSERLNRVIGRLHGSLHEVMQNLYHVTRLVEARSEVDTLGASHLETIKGDAEAITIATVRLIYMTARLR
ncbi:Helix-hairpin-helix DNA-binding motif-containing protein [Pseudomonas viridiflava]|uniref:Helix-hairpin-helix DNA-binding motif-containing protein n=2 Tax=Pseudomonas viridiflava TaxID=33069 RepID=A0A3M5PIT9_PSEVI|nr:Helix-hairpin-helix DNA-binding motif-containing protein [Pseudomonas viridiflava]